MNVLATSSGVDTRPAKAPAVNPEATQVSPDSLAVFPLDKNFLMDS